MRSNDRPIARVAVYCRVSTASQDNSNQVHDCREYARARGWTITAEYIDDATSGAKTSRPQLDRMMRDARARRFDGVLVAKLDRLGRSISHLIAVVEEWSAIGIALVSINEGLDLSSPAGRLQIHLLSAFAQFERERIRERVISGIAKARRAGTRLGRKPARITDAMLDQTAGLSTRAAAKVLGLSKDQIARARLSRNPPISTPAIALENPEAATPDRPSRN